MEIAVHFRQRMIFRTRIEAKYYSLSIKFIMKRMVGINFKDSSFRALSLILIRFKKVLFQLKINNFTDSYIGILGGGV